MSIVGVDTETVREAPWSVQMATNRNRGEMYYCDNPKSMGVMKGVMENPEVLTVVHNAGYDLRVLGEVGIHPYRTECTMQMAYLLGLPLISLKVLAYRICGIEMRSFEEVTYEATQAKAERYLDEVLAQVWPDPEPIMKIGPDGEIKFTFPKNIKGKAQKLLDNYTIDHTVDIRKKWKAMDETGGRGLVEEAMGPMQQAYLDEVDREDAEAYAKLDAYATLAIYPYLHDEIERYDLQGALELDMATIPMVTEMEVHGVLKDDSVLVQLKEELNQLTEDTQADIDFLAGHYINPNSSQQVSGLLQDMGIFQDMETSTDAKILDQYRDHTIVTKVQDYRGYAKLRSTYVNGLMKRGDDNNRVHTRYSTTRTETGRLASSDPNLQNIPVRTELGRRVREAFVAEEGCSLLALDYSQIELRIAAHESQDPTMLEIFWNDGDMHMTTACGMFGLPPEEIDDKAHRRPAKVTNFGTIYLISAKGLWTNFQHEGLTSFSELDCQRFLDSWRETYPGFFDWVSEITAEARRTGMVRDMYGRLRFIPELNSSLKYVREAGIRQAVNAPVQGGAGGGLKEAIRALRPVVKEWQDMGVVCRPLLQVHDELIFEVEDEYLPMVAPQFREVMTDAIELSVPVKVDCEVGKNWKALKEYVV